MIYAFRVLDTKDPAKIDYTRATKVIKNPDNTNEGFIEFERFCHGYFSHVLELTELEVYVDITKCSYKDYTKEVEKKKARISMELENAYKSFFDAYEIEKQKCYKSDLELDLVNLINSEISKRDTSACYVKIRVGSHFNDVITEVINKIGRDKCVILDCEKNEEYTLKIYFKSNT
jgi:hypothetical protein